MQVDVPGGSSAASLSLYLDEDMPQGAIAELTQRGYLATYARRVLPPSTSDDDHLRYAAEHDCVFVTRNRHDFELLHHAWLSWSRAWRVRRSPQHRGILITPGDWDAARIAEEIDRFLQTGPVLANALYTWSSSRAWERRPDPP